MFKYIELVYNIGIRGFVFDEKGCLIEGVKIIIENCVKKVKIYKDGDYWCLLVFGSYIVWVVKKKYKNLRKIIMIDLDVIVYVNFIFVRKRLKNFNRCWLVMKMNFVV